MMMQPGMMQMAALHQLGLLPPGMHPGISCGLLGSGMQGADMGGQHGRDSPEPQQGPQGSSRPPPHNRQSDKKTAALDREGGAGTHEKLFAADLQSYSHMELHRRRQESERGAESNPTDRHNDHHPELGSSACSPEREHVSGEGPPSPRTKGDCCVMPVFFTP